MKKIAPLERQVYKLSDAYCWAEKDPKLKLKVTVININPGCSQELLERCESLKGYMSFVEKVRALKVPEAERKKYRERLKAD